MDAERFNALLRLIDTGDENALDEIRKHYETKIKWIGHTITKDWHHAKDVLMSVLKTLWNKSHKFINIEIPDACIYDLAKKAAHTFRRKYLVKHENEKSIETISLKDQRLFLVHNDEYIEVEFISQISCLDETEQQIIIKKIGFNFTHAEIAAELHMPEGTARWKYQQILEKLRKNIKKEENSS